MSNLLIEIGNTALKASWADGVILGKNFRYQGEKKMEYILSLTEKEKPEVLTIATSGTISDEDIHTLSHECSDLLILDDNKRVTGNDFPSYLSSDRIASVTAARYLFKGKACSVFDFGTIMKIDFLSPEGTYLGGNISLGCRTRFKALNRYSRTLPLVDTPESFPSVGNSLVSSIETGIISGIMFEIEGYIGKYPDNVLIFTGGDALYFANRLKSSIFVVSNLSMMGLAIITDDYVKKNIQ